MKSCMRQGRSQTRVATLCMRLALCALVVVAIASVRGRGVSQPVAGDARPEELVNRLKKALSEGQIEESEALVTALQDLGEAAIPAVTAGLGQADEPLSGALARVLQGIPGDASTSLLLGMLEKGGRPGIMGLILGTLENREVRRPLFVEEFDVLVAYITEANIVVAGSAARILARCLLVQADQRTARILERFEREVTSPSEVGSVCPSYLSPRVLVLNQFLLAVSYIGEPAMPALRERKGQTTNNPELEKWLLLALGMAGDPSQAGELKQLVLHDPDKYIRWAAVHSYARSAKRDAIPVLQSLLNDTTEGEYDGCVRIPGQKTYLIRFAARDELARLER